MLISKLTEAFSLRKIEKNIIEAKNLEKAKDFYMKMLRKKLVFFLKKFKQNRVFFEKNFENTRENYFKRMVFSQWFEKIPILRQKNQKKAEYYDKIVQKFRLVLYKSLIFS